MWSRVIGLYHYWYFPCIRFNFYSSHVYWPAAAMLTLAHRFLKASNVILTLTIFPVQCNFHHLWYILRKSKAPPFYRHNRSQNSILFTGILLIPTDFKLLATYQSLRFEGFGLNMFKGNDPIIYTAGQKFGIFGKHNGNSRIWHLDLLQMAWHQPQINMVTLM